MTSAVNVYDGPIPATQAQIDDPGNYTNTKAKQYVLLGGTLLDNDTLRAGVGNRTKAYSTTTPSGKPNRLGVRPMPGITSIDIKSLSAYGSLREVTVNFQCWDIRQLEDLELLYMRPGYTVLVEWGWLPYLDNNGQLVNSVPKFYDDILNGSNLKRSDIFDALHKKCLDSGGNYDAMYGYIKNYQWSARADGGYDCQATVISTGEVIESLKVNYVRADLANYNLYVSGSVPSFGFLQEAFTDQGNFSNISELAGHYEKNIVAGVWAELFLKIYGGAVVNPDLFPAGSVFSTQNFPALQTTDPNLTISTSIPSQIYITLDKVCDVLNDYVIARTIANSTSSSEPLVKLSTKLGMTTHGSTDSLLCLAHPLQVSIDPSICLIKSPLWYNNIIPQVKTQTAGVSASLTQITDEIFNELKDATDNPDRTSGTDEDKFASAIGKIRSEAIRQSLDSKISKEKIDGYKSLEELINWEFTKGDNDPLSIDQPIENPSSRNTIGGLYSVPSRPINENVVFDTISHRFEVSNAGNDTANLIYLYKLTEISKDVFDIQVNLIKNETDGTEKRKTLQDLLRIYQGNVTFNRAIDIDAVQASEFILKVLEGKASVSYINGKFVQGLEIYTFSTNWRIENIKIVPKGGTSSGAQTATIIFNTDNAIASIKELERLERDFFYGNPNGLDELATTENIYVNLNYLYRQSVNTSLEAQDSKEKNEINLYSYIKSIMSGIQSAIGNINNFEIHVDPVDNYVARIIDVNYTGDDKIQNLFPLEVHNTNSTVRSYSLQSQIFPNQSSIIAIGSQAKGGQLGIQNNTMIDFNNQIRDRIIPKKTAGKKDDLDDNNFIVTNSIATIIQLLATLNSEDPAAVNDIDTLTSKAKNSLRDIIVYFQRLFDTDGGRRNIIPIQFSFEMDGIGGLIIGNLFKINQDILPRGYKGKNLAQTVTKIAHNINNNDWKTNISALNIILDKKGNQFKVEDLTTILRQALKNAIDRALPSATSIGGSGDTCFGASSKTVDNVYPRSVKFGGNGAVIVSQTSYPTVAITLSTLPQVQFQETSFTAEQYVEAAIRVIDKLAPGISAENKAKILTSAFAISRTEQPGEGLGFKGFNNNISGIESSGFKVFDKSDVTGKVKAKEGGTNILKDYYAFKSLDAGLVPLISKIMERNMFATNKTAGEWVWRYYRDWNGYGARKTPSYKGDCDVLSGFIKNYNDAAILIPTLLIKK
jgi:hypothetical protein